MTRTLGVALLSAIHHQDYLSRAFAANPHCRIVAVGEEPTIREDFRDRAPALATRYGVPFVEDVDALLAREDVDVVSVGTEIVRHGRLALKAIEAGKHVHVDKPMASSLAECRALERAARAAERRGKKVISFSRFLVPAIQRARRKITAGAIGQPRGARGEYVVTYGPGEDYDPVRDERRFHPRWTGGGEIMLHGMYPLTNLRYLLGLEFTSVQCFLGALFNRYSREFGTDDYTTMVLTMTGGVAVSVALGRACAPRHPSLADISVRVMGTRGMIVADEYKPYVSVYGTPLNMTRDSDQGVRFVAVDGEGVQEMIDHFVRSIVEDRPAEQSITDALRVMEACFAAEESARTGRPVRIGAN